MGSLRFDIDQTHGEPGARKGCSETMKCPNCGFPESKVTDSRPNPEGNSIRRRRVCPVCLKKFTTFETVEVIQLVVVKKNGGKELFDKQKLLSGILKATEKRPVDAVILTNEIEAELQNTLRQEVTSVEIGEMVMRKLKERDEVAYVRFASVYREFRDIDSFLAELNGLKDRIDGTSRKEP